MTIRFMPLFKQTVPAAALALICASGIGIAHAHESNTPRSNGLSWKATEVAPGIYMLEGQGGNPGANLGLLTGEEGSILIDNGLPVAIPMTMATVQGMAGGTIDFVINTHGHLDHTGGNPGFAAAGAMLFSHDNARQEMQADEQYDQSGLPNITFNDRMTLHLNGQATKVFYMDPAHTDSDVVIHFTDANVMHAGDMFFNGVFPFIDQGRGGTLDGFIAGQRKILELANDDTLIIPGHGPLGRKSDLQRALDMLVDARVRVKTLVDLGLSKEETVAQAPLAIYDDWGWHHISTDRMTGILHELLVSD